MTEGKRYAVGRQAIWEVLDGEVVIANLDGGSYYTLGGSGVAIWSGLAAGRTVDTVIADVTDAVGEDVRLVARHATELLDQCVADGLLTESEDEEPAGQAGAQSAAVDPEWVVPTFEKFTDMQQLLLLDPIHEVDDSGWPRKVDPS